MRIGEVLSIRWSQVDLVEKEIRLEPGTTKNDEARTLPIDGELYEVVRLQQEVRDRKYPSCSWVFSHHGQRILSVYRAWRSACAASGLGKRSRAYCGCEVEDGRRCGNCPDKRRRVHYSGLIPHDLRRTGARNLIRSGVSRSVARRITGHKTESVFERYNITSPQDLRQAAKSLTRYIEEKEKKSQSTTKVALPESAKQSELSTTPLN